MIDNKFEQVLFLTMKSLIASSSSLSHIDIYREVRNNMISLFGEEESFTKLCVMNKEEDFKDILNFCLTMLNELGLIYQKNENQLILAFKWLGIKGFVNKYLLSETLSNCLEEEIEPESNFEVKLQLFTKKFLASLIYNVDSYIDTNVTQMLTNSCELNGYENQVDKIIALLLFLEFITNKGSSVVLNIKLFNHSSLELTEPNNILAERRNKPLYTEPEQFSIFHNNVILNKINFWKEIIDETKRRKDINQRNSAVKFDKVEQKIVKQTNKASDHILCKENEILTNIKESGFALLKSNDWTYYMNELSCIIGRCANDKIPKGRVFLKNIPWEIDVNLGEYKKISKQHALIIYNFEESGFEIKNISKKQIIKVNDNHIEPQESILLNNKSIISIGHQEFTFYLPLD
jgi:hypothetical protein